MSAVSGVGGLSTELLQSLLQAQKQNETDSTRQTPPADEMGPQQLWTEIEESAETAGLTTEEVDELKSTLRDAIASAMNEMDSSEGPEAAREAIDGAILTTLQERDIDTTNIEARMEEAKSKMPGGPPLGGPPPSGSPRSDATASGDSAGGGSTLLSLVNSEEDEAYSLISSLFPLVDEEA